MQVNKVTRRRRCPWKEYDYEETYTQDSESLNSLEDEKRAALIKQEKGGVYATKTVRYGGMMDVEVYPEFAKLPSSAKRKCSPEAKRALNDRNSRKECERLINENFGSADYWITLSYMPGEEPEDQAEALHDLQRWVRRINYRRKKDGLPPARYVYVSDWTKNGRRVRAHHHVVIDGAQPLTDMLALWEKGRRNKGTPLVLDENGLSGLARYMTKPHAPDTEETKNKRKWCASKNLQRAPERKNHRTFRRRKVEHLAEHPADLQTTMETQYPAFWYERGEVRWNGCCGLFYVSAQLREKAAAGDIITISGRPEALENIPIQTRRQLRARREYILLATDGQTAIICPSSGKGKKWAVPLRACIVDRRRKGVKKTWN